MSDDKKIRVTQNFDYERPIGYATYDSETGKVEITIHDPEIKRMLGSVDLKTFSLGWGYMLKPPAVDVKTLPSESKEAREKLADRNVPRLKSCLEGWPEAEEGEYNPYCCRFPKSCSADIYDEDRVNDSDLEPFHRHPISLKRHRGQAGNCLSSTCQELDSEMNPTVAFDVDVTPRDTSNDPEWKFPHEKTLAPDETQQPGKED